MVCFLQIDYYNLDIKIKMKNENIITGDVKHEDEQAAEILKTAIHFLSLANYDEELTKLTKNINEPEDIDLLEEIEI